MNDWRWTELWSSSTVAVTDGMLTLSGDGDRAWHMATRGRRHPTVYCELWMCGIQLWNLTVDKECILPQPHVWPLGLSNRTLPWERLQLYSPFCSHGTESLQNPPHMDTLTAPSNHIVCVLLIFLGNWQLSEQSDPASLFIMMSCPQWKKSCVISGEGNLFKHMVAVMIIMISLLRFKVLQSDRLWKSLRCPRLVSIRANYPQVSFPLSSLWVTWFSHHFSADAAA